MAKTGLVRRVATQLARRFLDLKPIDTSGRGGWQVLESYMGAFQQGVTVNADTVNAYWAVYGCITLIANDISKLPPRVMEYDERAKIWRPTRLRPVLNEPNQYQTTIEFLWSWVCCELRHGNTYVLKVRNSQGFVVSLHILDPCRVEPLITKDGGVYYRLKTDELNGLEKDQVIVPASEIIHDRMNPLFHPLVGTSPIFACGVAAMQGAAILTNSTAFFQNMSRPSGILSAEGEIADETAARLKELWDTQFKGENSGKIAVVGDGLKYQPMTITATDAQLIEQLKMTGEQVCGAFHVPPYKLGLGQMPTANNTAVLNQQYYDQCLQQIIERLESRLTVGLELDGTLQQVWLDLEPLLRMDPQTRITTRGIQIKDGWLSPNEARREEDLEPVEGGESPMAQQQNYSLAALAKRDALADPFNPTQPAASAPANAEDSDDSEDDATVRQFLIRSAALARIAHARTA